MRVGIDTNILVYAADPRDKTKQDVAREMIRRTALAQGALAQQCLFEFLSVTTRRLHQQPAFVVAVARKWGLILDIVVPSVDVFNEAIALMNSHQISGWDARLVATYASNGVGILVSEDLQDGGRYGSVTVINPFLAANATQLDRVLPP